MNKQKLLLILFKLLYLNHLKTLDYMLMHANF